MKNLLCPLFFVLLLNRIILAAPLALSHQLVFTRGQVPHQTVWTMNADGQQKRRVWHVPTGYGQFGGFSRDGTQAISYNNFNLYVHDLKKNRLRRLLLWSAGWGTAIENPSFSPDGQQVLCAVSSENTPAKDSDVLRLNVKGNYSVNVANSIARARVRAAGFGADFPLFQPQWSADGKNIIAVGGLFELDSEALGGNLEIYTMRRNGSRPHQLTHNDFWEELPAWNARRTKIVFVRYASGKNGDYQAARWPDIYLMNADGSGTKALTFNKKTRGEINISRPLFNGAGTQIAWTQNGVIWRVGSDGHNRKNLGDGTLVQWIG